MNTKKIVRLLAPVIAAAAFAASPLANATPIVQEVTYTWTANSSYSGPTPIASFDVTLSAVQTGKITYSDISNVTYSFAGLTLNNPVISTLGNDFAAFVNPTTGALIYKDANQGLAIEVIQNTSINDPGQFLSITFDTAVNGAVKDTFNAYKNANNSYSGSGYWTATLPQSTAPAAVPEPASLALLGLGLAAVAFGRRRKSK